MAKAANGGLDKESADGIAADTLLGVSADDIAPKKKGAGEYSDEDIDGLSDGEREEVPAPPERIPSDKGGRRRLKEEAMTIEHLLTHKPKNPYCEACCRGNMCAKGQKRIIPERAERMGFSCRGRSSCRQGRRHEGAHGRHRCTNYH